MKKPGPTKKQNKWNDPFYAHARIDHVNIANTMHNLGVDKKSVKSIKKKLLTYIAGVNPFTGRRPK